MVTFAIIVVVLIAIAALVFVSRTLMGKDSAPADSVAPEANQPTVTLSGEIMMVSHDGLHHPVAANVTASLGRRIVATATVREDNGFSMQVPADIRGELEVSLGLHGSSTSLVTANGSDMNTVVIYNPVNNFFA